MRGVSGLQWAADAYTVTLASLLMFSGALADRIGRRAVLQAGLSVFVLGSWLCSLAPGLGCLIAFRVLQGAGASGMNPAALGIVATCFPDPARRARAVGVAFIARAGTRTRWCPERRRCGCWRRQPAR